MSAKARSGKKESARRAKKQTGILVEAAENIEEGAEVVGEKLSEVAGQTAEVAGEILAAMKKRLHHAFELGSRAVEEAARSGQEYAEKYKQHTAMKRLAAKRKNLAEKLGLATYRHFRERRSAPELLFEDKQINDLVSQIEQLDAEVIKIGEDLEKTTQ